MRDFYCTKKIDRDGSFCAPGTAGWEWAQAAIRFDILNIQIFPTDFLMGRLVTTFREKSRILKKEIHQIAEHRFELAPKNYDQLSDAARNYRATFVYFEDIADSTLVYLKFKR